MVRAVDKADAMLTLSSALWYRKPFTIFLPCDSRATVSDASIFSICVLVGSAGSSRSDACPGSDWQQRLRCVHSSAGLLPAAVQVDAVPRGSCFPLDRRRTSPLQSRLCRRLRPARHFRPHQTTAHITHQYRYQDPPHSLRSHSSLSTGLFLFLTSSRAVY